MQRREDDLIRLVESLAPCTPPERSERLRALRLRDPELCDEVERHIRETAETRPHPSHLSELNEVPNYPSDALIAGRYRVERQLARGGFGIVYRAKDERLHGKPVVVKFLACEAGGDKWFRKKFDEEIQALSLIDHPGVVGILDAGTDERGIPFLVIQFIEGSTLRALLQSGGMPLAAIGRIMGQVGQALAAAHSSGILHRDLKPENIMVQPAANGEIVRLIDFGIAAIRQPQMEHSAPATRVVGTLAYMAPEQFRGQATTATDTFAMGVIAWEMLVGRVPFGNMSIEEVLGAQDRGPGTEELRQLRPDVPAAAMAIIYKALSIAPALRYQTASALGDDLAAALADAVESGRLVSSPSDIIQRRALDVAMARHVPVRKPAEVVALIRQSSSGGLTALLRQDDDHSVKSEDVRSKAFELEFPVDQMGRRKPLELGLRLECPDFEPSVLVKTVVVSPDGDSDACTFLITPIYLGELRVNLEIVRGDVLIASRTLKTEATTSERAWGHARVLVSIPLSVVVRDSTNHQEPLSPQHGDRMQLEQSAPDFALELDPPPAGLSTRLAELSAPPTREAKRPMSSNVGNAIVPLVMMQPHPSSQGPVDRATVERLVGDVATQMNRDLRKSRLSALVSVLSVVVMSGGYFVWNHQQQAEQAAAALAEQHQVELQLAKTQGGLMQARDRQDRAIRAIDALRNSKSPENTKKLEEAFALKKASDGEVQKLQAETTKLKADQASFPKPKPVDPVVATAAVLPVSAVPAEMTPEQIYAANVKSVILIEAAWKITDTSTGSQIYLYHHRNDLGACQGSGVKNTDYLPMFVEDGGTLYPVLSTLPNEGNNTPIVGTHSGSGFIVGGEGFFLTNRHVLAPWRATWNLASFTRKTMGLKVKNNSIVGCITSAEFPTEWVPSEGSKMVVDKMESVSNPVTGLTTNSTYSDRLKYNPLTTSVQGEAVFNVTFAETTQRYRATSVTVSEKHDIALGKVDVPGGGQKVTMFTDSDGIKPGQPVVVMGYPAISPDVFGVEASRDMFTNKAHLSAIADPTLTTGPISSVPASGNSVNAVDGVISNGEVYQLGITTTGAGNSGGPVFDSKGRVVAVFYAGRSYGGATVTYAVPVKFGRELLGNPSVIR